MTKTMFALSLGLAGVLLATQAAQAAPQCGPRDAVLATLADKYRETRQGMGIAANNSVMELFASAASGTWTITVTMPDRTEYVATLVGRDPDSDLAVLKIEGRNLPHVAFGDSTGARVGDWVIAIGRWCRAS